MKEFLWHLGKSTVLIFMIASAISEQMRYMVMAGFVLIYLEQLRSAQLITRILDTK